MIRMIPVAAGLALALAAMTPAFAREEGTFQPGVVASPASGPAAAGVRQYRPDEEQYNDGTHVAVPETAAAPSQHGRAGGYPPGSLYNDGMRAGS